ncbi:MAG: glycosyltransferase family 87 protein [Bacteroidota bacterium]
MLLACAVGAVFSSGPGYLLQVALAGRATDFTRDYVAAHWLTAGKPLSQLDGAAGNADAARLGADPVLVPCGPFHLHPPPASLLVLPLVPLGFRAAALAWLLLSLAALAVLARVLASVWSVPGAAPSPRRSIAALLIVTAWPPTVMNLAYGQWSILLAALVAVGWWGIERGRGRLATASFVAAIGFKTTPAVMLGFLVLRRRALLVRVLGALAFIVAASWPLVGGWDAWRTFVRDGRSCVLCWEAYVDNTVSINGLYARLLVGGPYVRAPFDAPALAHLLAPATACALIALAAVLTWRHARARPAAGPAGATAAGPLPADALDFAMWAALVALLNPLSWTHNAVFLLLPIVLVVRHGRRARVRTVVAAAFVALCIPRETLFAWAGPLPFAPARAWVLGLHAVAGLTVFGCAAWEGLGAAPATGTRPR